MKERDNMTGQRIVAGISLPLGDTHFADHLMKGPLFGEKGTYQFAKIEAALAVVDAGKRSVALDIGGHVGLWARVLAHHFQRVVSLEPLPALHPHFRFNTADCENVKLIECAAGDTDGEIDIVTVADNSGNGYVAPKGVTGPTVFKAPVVRIDSLNIHDVGFIKIDVEGWELPVIMGAQRVIRRDWPVIVVEQKPNNAERHGMTRLAAVDQLKAWGYVVAWERSGDFCMKWQGATAA